MKSSNGGGRWMKKKKTKVEQDCNAFLCKSFLPAWWLYRSVLLYARIKSWRFNYKTRRWWINREFFTPLVPLVNLTCTGVLSQLKLRRRQIRLLRAMNLNEGNLPCAIPKKGGITETSTRATQLQRLLFIYHCFHLDGCDHMECNFYSICNKNGSSGEPGAKCKCPGKCERVRDSGQSWTF